MKRYQSLILGTIMACTALVTVGCDEQSSSPTPNFGSTETVQTVNIGDTLDGRILMNSFEVFDRDVQLIRLLGNFGRVSQNTDMKYVRTGTKSLQITPVLPEGGASFNPYIWIPTNSLRYQEELKFNDFTKVDYVSLWFYNAEEENVSVGICASSGTWEINRYDYSPRTYPEMFTLTPGWNHIQYDVLPEYIGMQNMDVTETMCILVEFDFEQVQAKGKLNVYLDDITLAYLDKANTNEVEIKTPKGVAANGNEYWELTDFEDSRQGYYWMYHYFYPAPVGAYPMVKTCFAGDYGIRAKSGTQVMLIRKSYGDTSYGWPTLRLSKDVFCTALETIGQDIIDNPQNYAVKFDMYNASERAERISVEYEGMNTYGTVLVESKRWVEYSFNIKDLDDISQLANAWRGGSKVSEDGTYIELRWETAAERTTASLLLDNVRIEKIA